MLTDDFVFPGEEIINSSNDSNKIIENKADVKTSQVFKPTAYAESVNIVNTMIEGNDVIIDLEILLTNPDMKLEGQRLMDYVCGACQVLNYSVDKVNSYTFILVK